MIRALCLIGGLTGAAGLSQFPEFSQQYLQRLAGQVDALTVVSKDFDASALAAGLGREEALEQMTGSPFLEARQLDMRRTFARHARLTENLIILRAATPLERLALPHRMADPATVQAVWADFTPAVPLSVAGAASAGTGFVGGWAVFAGLLAAISLPFRRSRARSKPSTPRREPGMKPDNSGPRLTAGPKPASPVPRLSGVQR